MTRSDDHRRHPRLASACRVEMRDRFATWSGQTADIGPRGCLVVTARAPTVGALLSLSIASKRVQAPLEVAGQVVWMQKGPPVRAGISFAGAIRGANVSPSDWFDALLAAEIGAALGLEEGSAALASVMVYLGLPPPSEALGMEEAEFIRSVGEGARLVDVLAARGNGDLVASLLARRMLTLVRSAAAPLARWEDALSRKPGMAPNGRFSGDFAKAPPAGFEAVACAPAEPSMSPTSLAQILLDRAVDALLDGDAFVAERVLRRAHQAAPGDATIQSILLRIEAHRVSRARAAIRLGPEAVEEPEREPRASEARRLAGK